MSGPSISTSTGVPAGTFFGPRLAEMKPDPNEAGVTVFVMEVRYKGRVESRPSLDLAVEGAQNLVSLADKIAAYEEAAERIKKAEIDLQARKERLQDALSRVDALVEDRVRRGTASAHRRANHCETELRKLGEALRIVGEAMGVE